MSLYRHNTKELLRAEVERHCGHVASEYKLFRGWQSEWRKAAIVVIENTLFKLLMGGVEVLAALLCVWEGVHIGVVISVSGFLFIDMAMVGCAVGYPEYLRSARHVVECSSTLCMAMYLLLAAQGTTVSSLLLPLPLRLLKQLRPFVLTDALYTASPYWGGTLATALSLTWFFILLGLFIWADGLHYRCINPAGDFEAQDDPCGDKACGLNYTCQFSQATSSHTGLDNFGDGLLYVLQVATFDDWAQLLLKLEHRSGHLVIFFFISINLFISFFGTGIMLSVIARLLTTPTPRPLPPIPHLTPAVFLASVHLHPIAIIAHPYILWELPPMQPPFVDHLRMVAVFPDTKALQHMEDQLHYNQLLAQRKIPVSPKAPPAPAPRTSETPPVLKKILTHPAFTITMWCSTIVNSIVLWLSRIIPDDAVRYVSYVCSAVFLVEACLIVAVLRRDMTGFDTLRCVLSAVSLWYCIAGTGPCFNALRLLGLLQYMQYSEVAPIQRVACAIVHSVNPVMASFGFCSLLWYWVTVIGMTTLDPLHDERWDRNVFDGFWESLLTAYGLFTMEKWAFLTRRAMQTESQWAVMYFIFVVLLSFGMHTLLRAILLSSYKQVASLQTLPPVVREPVVQPTEPICDEESEMSFLTRPPTPASDCISFYAPGPVGNKGWVRFQLRCGVINIKVKNDVPLDAKRVSILPPNECELPALYVATHEGTSFKAYIPDNLLARVAVELRATLGDQRTISKISHNIDEWRSEHSTYIVGEEYWLSTVEEPSFCGKYHPTASGKWENRETDAVLTCSQHRWTVKVDSKSVSSDGFTWVKNKDQFPMHMVTYTGGNRVFTVNADDPLGLLARRYVVYEDVLWRSLQHYIDTSGVHRLEDLVEYVCKVDIPFRNALLATGTKQILYMSDPYWGGKGNGLNEYGKILMRVRNHVPKGECEQMFSEIGLNAVLAEELHLRDFAPDTLKLFKKHLKGTKSKLLDLEYKPEQLEELDNEDDESLPSLGYNDLVEYARMFARLQKTSSKFLPASELEAKTYEPKQPPPVLITHFALGCRQLGCIGFSTTNSLRTVAGIIRKHFMYSTILTLVIIGQTVAIWFDVPNYDESAAAQDVNRVCDIVITLVFMMESLLGVIQMGLVRNENAYLRNTWDLLMAWGALFAFLGLFVPVVKPLRGVVLFRFMHKDRFLSRVTKRLVGCVGDVISVMLAAAAFGMLWGILGIQILNEKDESMGDIYATLWDITLSDGWLDTLYNSPGGIVIPYYCVYVFVVRLLLFLFPAIVLCRDNNRVGYTDLQLRWMESLQYLKDFSVLRPPPQEPQGGSKYFYYLVANHKLTTPSVNTCIACVCIVLSTHVVNKPTQLSIVHRNIAIALIVSLTLEVCVKVLGWGPKHYVRDNWRRVDLLTVVVAWVGVAFGNAEIFAAFTMSRLFRLYILLEDMKWWLELAACLRSFLVFAKHVVHVLAFLLLFLFLTGGMGIQLFGASPNVAENSTGLNPYMNFENYPNAMMLSFRIAVGEGLTSIISDLGTSEARIYTTVVRVAGLVVVGLFVAQAMEAMSYALRVMATLRLVSLLDPFIKKWKTKDKSGLGNLCAHDVIDILCSLPLPLWDKDKSVMQQLKMLPIPVTNPRDPDNYGQSRARYMDAVSALSMKMMGLDIQAGLEISESKECVWPLRDCRHEWMGLHHYQAVIIIERFVLKGVRNRKSSVYVSVVKGLQSRVLGLQKRVAHSEALMEKYHADRAVVVGEYQHLVAYATDTLHSIPPSSSSELTSDEVTLPITSTPSSNRSSHHNTDRSLFIT